MKKSYTILSILLAVFFCWPLHGLGQQKGAVVGKIADHLSVTPLGQACYSIPVKTVPGTGGMVPRLTISYSSSNRDGMLGYGFDLTGLSVISRAPRNLHTDGRAGTVTFNVSDRFVLDGARLVQVSSAENRREYRTENNTFSRIWAEGTDAVSPTAFIVQTKEGITYEYMPNTDIPGAESTDKPLFWLLAKATDTKGNFFKVTYGGDALYNDWWPVRIDYTGNTGAGLSPYASLRFQYQDNALAATTYVGGHKVRRGKVLTSITSYYEESKAQSYLLSYTTVNGHLHLYSVTEQAADGTQKPPTCFSWYDMPSTQTMKHDYSVEKLVEKARITVGDFNGDGISDFVTTPRDNKSGWTGWRLFLGNKDKMACAATGQFSLSGVVEDALSGDFNGDGYDDLVIKRKTDRGYHDTDLYLSDGKGSLVFATCMLAVKSNYTLYVGEMTGDGAADLIACYDKTHRVEVIQSVVDSGTWRIDPLGTKETLTSPDTHDWKCVTVADFNGDGLSDILNRHSDGYTIWYADGSGGFRGFDSGPWPGSAHSVFSGDFNGDGKTDLLVTAWSKDPNASGWSNWCVCFSKGEKPRGNDANPFEKKYFPRSFNTKQRIPFVIDINGDGKDDFYGIAEGKTDDGFMGAQAFINDGTGYGFDKGEGAGVYGMDLWEYHIGDFNGDGKQDFLCSSTWDNGSSWYGFQVYLMPEGTVGLLKSVTDGIGVSTSITYAPMSNDGVYVRGTESSYPLSSFGSTWPVVSAMETPDGIGGIHRTTYRYDNAIMHKRGRGFLAFGQFTARDEVTGVETIQHYDVDSTEYVTAPVATETRLNGKVLSEEHTAYKLVYQNYVPAVYTYLPVHQESKGYEYNAGTLTTHTVTDTEYDTHGNVTLQTVTIGDQTTVTQNTYDDDEKQWFLGRLVRAVVTRTDGTQTVSRTSEYNYDSASGMLIAEAADPDSPLYGYRKAYTHDLFGNVTESTVTPLGQGKPRITRTTYDGQGRFVVSSTNALGHTSSVSADPVTGAILSSVDANGLQTTHTYNSFGELLRTTAPLGTATSAMEWSAGHADAPAHALYYTREESTGQPVSLEFFDLLGRNLRTVTEGMDGKKIYRDAVYNRKGETVAVSEPYFAGSDAVWTHTEYDAVGRTLRQTAPDGSQVTWGYNGFSTSVTDPLGRTSTRRLNKYGQTESSTDAMDGCVTYTYDINDNCIRVQTPSTQATAVYDTYGHRLQQNDPDAGTTRYTYDAYGQMLTETTAYGTTYYQYDLLGRLVDEQRPDMRYQYEYDTRWVGALSSSTCTDDMGQEFSYDAYGRVITATEFIHGEPFTVHNYYTNDNHLAAIQYPNKFTVSYSYTPSGYLKTVNDDSGNVLWKVDKTNARGQIEGVSLFGGQTISNSYDPQTGHVATVRSQNSKGRDLVHWEYAFDKVGNLSSRHDVVHAMTERFDYDALNRLTMVWQADTIAQRMAYDAAGNIVTKSDVGYYNYTNGSNRLQYVQSRSYSPPVWDRIGYTSFGKIAHLVQEQDSLDLLYGVDKTRKVAIMFRGKDIETTVYVGNLYERTYTAKHTEERMFVYAGGSLVAIVRNDGKTKDLYYVHKDHLGSVIAYTDLKGRLVQELSYDAWGRRRDPSTWQYYDKDEDASALQMRGFTGHEHLDVFMLVNMEGRMYDPVLGRFLSPDPIIQAPDFTQSHNSYAYCLNNPLALTDPSGYSWISSNWKGLLSSFVGITVAAVTGGTGSSIGVAIMAGAAGGASSALVGSLLNGANIGQVAKSTLTGCIWGAASGALNYVSSSPDFFLSTTKHALTEGILEGVQGGNICHGFLSGAVSGAGGNLIRHYGNEMGRVGMIVTNAVVGGTAEELGGGKFANGAMTSAYSMMFNDLMHSPEGEGDGVMQAAVTLALTTSAVDGPVPIGDAIGISIVSAAAIYEMGKAAVPVVKSVAKSIANTIEKKKNERCYVTYIMTNGEQIYVGRTSGYGTPEQLVARRYARHVVRRALGYGYPIVDRFAYGKEGSWAIRGREQQYIDYLGGIGNPKVGNVIRGVARNNVNGYIYYKKSCDYFGVLAPYTGIYR